MKTIETKILAKTNARTAGVLYLIIILSGLFSKLFVRPGIIVLGGTTATVKNIVANSFLFRIGFVSDLVMVMSNVKLTLLFLYHFNYKFAHKMVLCTNRSQLLI